jgi:hypothetical protein
MKFIKFCFIGVAALVLATVSLRAQTDTNAPSPATFFQTAEGYLTSFNPAYSWESNRLEIEVGADYQSGMQWANDIEGQYDVNGGNVIVGARLRNAGIGGVVEMAQAKLGYAIATYEDTRVEASLYAGYDNQYNCAVVEPELDLRKKLTENTFAGVYISEPILVQKHISGEFVPNIGIETGFTF